MGKRLRYGGVFAALAVVETTVTYAPGAEDNPLARWLGELVVNSANNARGRRALDRLRAAISVVAPDRRHGATLRFDHGLVTIHDGIVGIPDMTLCGDYDVLVRALQLPFTQRRDLALPALSFWQNGWLRSAADLLSGELKVYGIFTHTRLLWRFLRVTAPAS